MTRLRLNQLHVKITSFDQSQRLDHINLNIFEPAGHAADEGSVVAVLGHILPNIVRHVHLRYCHVWPGRPGIQSFVGEQTIAIGFLGML